MSSKPRQIEFFYDFSSPNAYFASVQLPPLASRYGAEIIWRPFLLGAVFKTLGTPPAPLMATQAKAEHTLADMQRWSRKYGVAFNFPSRFPMNPVKALRAAIALERSGLNPVAFVEAAFRAYWVQDADLASTDVLGTLLNEGGFDATAVLSAIETPQTKEALKRATDDALARKVFGTPTFILEGELFFGKDRLQFVEDALAAVS